MYSLQILTFTVTAVHSSSVSLNLTTHATFNFLPSPLPSPLTECVDWPSSSDRLSLAIYSD